MSIMLYNPTNEVFEMMFSGKTIFLNPGEKLKVDESCGKHLLNGFTPRGLCSLEHGDNEEEVGKDGKLRNQNFKKRMVMDHNQRNVIRKQQGLSYIEPTKKIQEYSNELGIGLDEPYAIRDKEKDRLLMLEKENQEQKKSISELTDLVRQLLDKETKPEEERRGPGRPPLQR